MYWPNHHDYDNNGSANHYDYINHGSADDNNDNHRWAYNYDDGSPVLYRIVYLVRPILHN